jgi:hypothetical protein
VTRARLTAATARAERAMVRNQAQAAMLRRAARAMGDHATAYLEAEDATHDDAATASATRGRYLARTLANGDT